MKKRLTYHCHSSLSDGRDTVEEMVDEAVKKGFDEIGLSDHLVLHPTIPVISWSMELSDIEEYVTRVTALKKRQDIRVLLGLEVDFFPGSPRNDEIMTVLKTYQFDYLIGSVHMLGEFSLDDTPAPWAALTIEEVNEKYLTYYNNIRLMVETGLYDFVGHLDLPKKFCFYPSIDISESISETLDAIKKTNMAVELNTAGWDKLCEEAYPSRDLLNQCLHKEIPVLINDDAHCTDEIGRHYDKAEAILRDLDYTNRWVVG